MSAGPPDGDGDVEVTGGGYRRPWWLYGLVGLVVVAVLVAVGLQLTGSAGSSPDAAAPAPAPGTVRPDTAAPGPSTTAPEHHPRSSPRITSCSVDLPAPLLRIDHRAGSGFEAWDCDAVPYGPRAWVLRDASTGSFGHHSAVVTFPVPATDRGTVRTRHGIRGWWSPHEVVVQLPGGRARVRGDLAPRRLAAIAGRLRVDADGRLHVQAPGGLRVTTRNGWYRPPLERTVRYPARALGEGEALGDGLAFVGILQGVRFEDELYAGTRWPPVERTRPVHGHPAVFSGVEGGNASLAWRRDDGTVVFVGYSGARFDREAKAALRRLTARVELVQPAEWADRLDWVGRGQQS